MRPPGNHFFNSLLEATQPRSHRGSHIASTSCLATCKYFASFSRKLGPIELTGENVAPRRTWALKRTTRHKVEPTGITHFGPTGHYQGAKRMMSTLALKISQFLRACSSDTQTDRIKIMFSL
jgi:hypothetical protein